MINRVEGSLQIVKILPAIVLLFNEFRISFVSLKMASSVDKPFLKPN